MSNKFQRKPVSQAVVVCLAALCAASAQAGPGFGDAVDLNKQPFVIPTFFVSSPSGNRLWTGVDATGNDTGVADPVGGAPAGYDPANRLAYKAMIDQLFPGGSYPGTGTALRKFVDPLPLPGAANAKKMADGVTDKYIPVAVPTKWRKPDGSYALDEYFEIAVVEFKDRFHTDLANTTSVRGYVQIDPFATYGWTEGHDRSGAVITAMPGSKQVPLTYPDGSPIMINKLDPLGQVVKDASGHFVKVQAIGVDSPRYLGPIVTATKDVPTRVRFLNLLPVGRARVVAPAEYVLNPDGSPMIGADGLPVIKTQASIDSRRGDLFLPLDPSVVGSGLGPDGVTYYTQNRANLHLHGGDNPWISDGTPHQWIAALGEEDPSNPNALAADPGLATELLPSYLRGPGAINVPDMPDPGPGAMTYYFPNGQSARLEWYHDHTVGQTRLNVYAGMASGYVLTDDREQQLIASGALPDADHTIPLILQDKTFVPKDVHLQDNRWNTEAWGGESSLWYPHVYETVQDPNQDTNFNAVGRWHWGPWFWPVFPALYNLPTGAYGDVSLVPEAWMDTPVINGVAYPTLEVEPRAYRFRILNASNDRTFTFNLFEADPSASITDALGTRLTEVKMVPVNSSYGTPCAPGVTHTDGTCYPETWTTDVYGHAGGVPDPLTQGPSLLQVASEGGWLPGVAKKDATPINYLLDKGRAAVLNVDYGTSGLHIANAERADVVIDFSQYAGKTLIVYNDSGAPVPAADPRNEYFTGYGDNSATGGAEDTLPGFGPNTRTMMRIVVKASTPAAPVVEADLDAAIKSAFADTQGVPIVAQSAYNAAYTPAKSWDDAKAFARIFTGSLKEPTFNFVPGEPNGLFNSLLITSAGSGYTRAPVVSVTAAPGDTTGKGAKAKASLQIEKITPINPGAGYLSAPVVTITSNDMGNGATATATMKVSGAKVNVGGSGYVNGAPVTFSLPPTAGGVRATGTLIVAGGAITGINVINPGSGYTTSPAITLPATAGVRAQVQATLSVDKITIDRPDPTNPNSGGGGGYLDLSTAASEPGNPNPGLIISFTPAPAGGTNASAGATGKVFDVNLTNIGSGYTAVPSVSVAAAPTETNAAAIVPAVIQTDTAIDPTKPQGNIVVKTKAIQELFDPTYGRLNATLGIEIPYTSALTQTTIPLGYVDAATEEFEDGETQIWKITHNGVDTHPVHFHLLNVQLINRVGWDNFISPPEPNELGWKETVKMSPLEDVIVAVRAKRPKTGAGTEGWGMPNSVRLLDPSQPEGATAGFTQINSKNGLPAARANEWADFGWEYVWHCHILGHEENDFMRPVAFRPNDVVPLAPTLSTAAADATGVSLGWVDNAATEYRFDVLRADVLPDGTVGGFSTIGVGLANAASYRDTTLNADSGTNASGGISVVYKVAAVGSAGVSESNTMTVSLMQLPSAPTNLAVTSAGATQIDLTWTDTASNEAGFILERSVNSGAWTPVAATSPVPAAAPGTVIDLPVNATSFSDVGLPSDATVDYRLAAVNAAGPSSYATVSAATLGTATIASVSAVAPSATAVDLSWSINVLKPYEAVTGYEITRTGGSGGTVTFTVSGATTTYADTSAVQNTAYTYTVKALNANVTPTLVGNGASASVTTPLAPAGVATPTGLTATLQVANSYVTIRWVDASNNETRFRVLRSSDGGATYATIATINRSLSAGTSTGATVQYNDATIQGGQVYLYQVVADRVSGATVTSSLPAGPVSVNYQLAAPGTPTVTIGQINVVVNWTDNSINENAFQIWGSKNGAPAVLLGTVNRSGTARTGTGQTVSFTHSATNPAMPIVQATDVTYAYYVVATANGGGQSPASATTVVSTPAVPASLTATSVVPVTFARANVNLSWAAVPGATSYRLERETSPGSGTFTQVTTTTSTSASANFLLRSATPYVFRVRANNTLGYSQFRTTSVVVN